MLHLLVRMILKLGMFRYSVQLIPIPLEAFQRIQKMPQTITWFVGRMY
uniref:Phospholipase D n=1 Tax=Rhizophora mucronata TaxID=61149 RepID=A0A2P2L0J3_RHIMU